MRCYHSRATTSCVLLLWCSTVALILSLEAKVALAAPGGCACGCSCSGNGCCPGCQEAYPNPPGWIGVQVGNYIMVPSCVASPYNYCNSDSSNFSCYMQQISCYFVAKGVKVTAYPNFNCTPPGGGMIPGPLYVYVTGCPSSGSCGGT